MEFDQLLKKAESMVLDKQDFDTIKAEIDQEDLSKEERNLILERVDELIFHLALDGQRRSRAMAQIIMGGLLFAFPMLIAILAYEPGSRITYIWYGAALLGGWQLKEGYKNYRAPFNPPDNFGYKRRKFQRF